MKKLMLLICGLAISLPAFAQQASDADVPDRAEVLKFLDLMHAREQMIQALQGMTKQMRVGAEDGFKQKVPDATPEQLAKLDQIVDGLSRSLPIDEMLEALIPIYQKHLTKSDLAAISAFYASAPGQKILKEMPAIMSESMEAGGEIGRKVFAAKSKELDQQVADLAEKAKKQKQ